MSAFPFLFLFNSDRFLFEKLLCKCSECMSVTRDRGKLGNDSSLISGQKHEVELYEQVREKVQNL